MWTQLRARVDSLRESYWLLPLSMTAASIVLAFSALAFDRFLGGRSGDAAWPLAMGADGARAILSTVAGSMITVAGVTFSVTMVALTLTSSQFGPRLLVNFMRDRSNQLVLGTFVATFSYCLLVLGSVRGPDGDVFVPLLSVTFALFLALASVGVLIYFIHHAAVSIQAERVIDLVGGELDLAIARFCAGGTRPNGVPHAPPETSGDGLPVRSEHGGYVQAIDEQALVRIASQNGLVLTLRTRPGRHLVAGSVMADVAPRAHVADSLVPRIRGAFVLGRERTLHQDLEFAIGQLVEIALRALSPGINDPFTAIACIDRLSVSLATLADAEIPRPERYDAEGVVRLVVVPLHFRGIVDAAFDQLRQIARTNAAVTIRLLEAIERILSSGSTTDAVEPLRRQAAMIHRGSRDLPEELDRRAVTQRWERIQRVVPTLAASQ